MELISPVVRRDQQISVDSRYIDAAFDAYDMDNKGTISLDEFAIIYTILLRRHEGKWEFVALDKILQI